MCDFVSSDDEGSYFDYEDFIYEEELSEDVTSEADESDLDIVAYFPYTAERKKQVVFIDDYIYYLDLFLSKIYLR